MDSETGCTPGIKLGTKKITGIRSFGDTRACMVYMLVSEPACFMGWTKYCEIGKLVSVSQNEGNSTLQRQVFVLNQPVILEEDEQTEFKEVTSQNPVSTITDTAEDYVVAFLNSKGGRIFWGIRDKDRHVIGISLDGESRDRVRKGIANRLHSIQPAIDLTLYDLQFYPVSGSAVPPDLYVVELSIKAEQLTQPFYNHRGEIYVRINGVKQKLVGPRLVQAL